MGVVDDTAAPSTQEDVSFWHHEDMATSHARMDPHFTYQLGDTSLSCEPDAPLEDGIEVVLPAAAKNPNTVRIFFFSLTFFRFSLRDWKHKINVTQNFAGTAAQDLVSPLRRLRRRAATPRGPRIGESL
jgi:hypothetical protein